jgi:hypothetical protein
MKKMSKKLRLAALVALSGRSAYRPGPKVQPRNTTVSTSAHISTEM